MSNETTADFVRDRVADADAAVPVIANTLIRSFT
jgi:hypothetical protein